MDPRNFLDETYIFQFLSQEYNGNTQTRQGLETLDVYKRQMPDMAGLKVVRPGLHLGTLKKNRFEPSHALALALRPEQVVRSLRLKAQGGPIVRYLKGETLPLDLSLIHI